LDIFNEGNLKQFVIGDFANDDWYRWQASQSCCPQPALTRYQLKPIAAAPY
jgi:hypothetical protein